MAMKLMLSELPETVNAAVPAEHDQLLRLARAQHQRAEENQQKRAGGGHDPEPALELPRAVAAVRE